MKHVDITWMGHGMVTFDLEKEVTRDFPRSCQVNAGKVS
jgi:hypothetical protein